MLSVACFRLLDGFAGMIRLGLSTVGARMFHGKQIRMMRWSTCVFCKEALHAAIDDNFF